MNCHNCQGMFWEDAQPNKKKKKNEEVKQGESIDEQIQNDVKGKDKEEGKEIKEDNSKEEKGFFGGFFGKSNTEDNKKEEKDNKKSEEKSKSGELEEKNLKKGNKVEEKNTKKSEPKPKSGELEEKKKSTVLGEQDNKTNEEKKDIYVDPNVGDESEYGFIPTKMEEEPKECSIFSILSIVASAPIVVSFLSISHIVRKIPITYFLVGSLLFSIHLFMSFFMTSNLIKENESSKSFYTTITKNCFPLSLAVNVYLCLLKYLTCIFLLDMFLESIYAVYPDIRPDKLSMNVNTVMVLLLVTLVVVVLFFLRKSIFIVLQGFNIVLIVAALLFLICSSIYSTNGVTNYLNIIDSGIEMDTSTILFLLFSFLCFSCECQSVSVEILKRTMGNPVYISLISVTIITLFYMSLAYFGGWILQDSLFKVLNVIVPSYSDLNRSLSESGVDSYNLLSSVSFISCLLVSLIGFLIQMKILSMSVISIFTILLDASRLIGIILMTFIVFSITIFVILNDIGWFLWWSIRILFFCAPFYSMYPYIATISNKNSNKLHFILSIVMVLILCGFVFLSFYCISVLSPLKLR